MHSLLFASFTVAQLVLVHYLYCLFYATDPVSAFAFPIFPKFTAALLVPVNYSDRLFDATGPVLGFAFSAFVRKFTQTQLVPANYP